MTADSDDRVVGATVKQGPSWVTLKDAAESAGVSVSTLRNWYRKGRIEARTVRGPNGEQRLVRLDEVVGLRGDKPVQPEEPGEWISLRDAAAESKVSISTLRNWYRKGLVESRMDSGPNGDQRMVRRDQILARADGKASSEKAASSNGAPETKSPSPDADEGRGALVPVAKALPDLIKELADARERAGRAETKAEFLSEQLTEVKVRAERLERSLAQLREERAQLQQPAELPEALDDLDDDLPLDFPREEDDEYLALVQRWRARRKRRRMLKRAAKSRPS